MLKNCRPSTYPSYPDYDDRMDEQCIPICNAINQVEGLETIESCCGHGEREFNIWFDVDSLENLPILLYYCDSCHVGFDWDCLVQTDCAMRPITFRLKSRSKGKSAYKEANIIADKILAFLKENK